jgi:DNA polymerase-3 subunit gamma/tau
MEKFVVSARKYRPAVFAHVLGQQPITTTLKNAIKGNHLAQAFLFCGPRGVGKTTCARILAKAINCQNLTLDIEPCNACQSCISFNQQRAFNIYELDAASNNSVEDIRSLVEQVRYPPQTGSYKVYIIDEVHMLSQAAFNAFLKTLEEPPSYAIFILATTEKYKVIPTILSRCQIFDFQRIQPQAIVHQLQTIAAQENIPYEEEGLHLISLKADGALRDALAMFDLIVTFGAGKLTYQASLENLHVLDYTYYFKLTDYLLGGQIADALLLYDEILRTGFDDLYFINGLSEHTRNLLICQDSATLHLLAVPPSIQAQYHSQSQKAIPNFLLSALQLINQYDIHYKNSHHKRLHIELCLIELAQLSGKSFTPAAITPPTQPSTSDTALGPTVPNTIVPTLASDLRKPSESPEATSTGPISQAYSANFSSNVTQGPASIPTTIKIPRLEQLHATLKNHKDNNQASVNPATPSKTLTQISLAEAWERYAAKLQEEGKLAAYRLLKQKIELQDTTITIPFTNAVQEDILRNIRESLLTYLRTALNCNELEIKGILIQEPKTRRPYTAQEKFNFLAKKNPSLKQLQSRLNLSILD